MHRNYIFNIGLALILLPVCTARADVRYTTEIKLGSGPAKSDGKAESTGAMRTTTFVKDNNERVESSMKIGPMQMNSVTITLCGQKRVLKLDPALKMYTSERMGAPSYSPVAASPGIPGGPKPRSSSKKKGEGKIITTFTVQDMGREKLNNLDTQHSMLTIRTQSSGCPGDSDNTMKMEMWVAPIPTVNCPDRYADGPSVLAGDGDADDGCKITYEFKGDVDAAKKLQGGMVVQMKMYDKDKVVMMQELREHSLALLDKTLFEVPADFKQVTPEQFAKMQQDAMMKAIMQGTGKDTEEAMREDAEADAEDAVEAKKEEKPKRPKIKIPGLPF